MPISLSGSLVLTGSITTTGGITISGSILSASYSATSSFSNDFTVLGNLTVFGTQSVQYITSSQLNVSDNVITVNVASPGVRFGGLSVFDSGSLSSESTASLFWDSQQNHWIYQRESGSTYNGGMLISGPRNSAGLGNESGTTSCMLLVGQGGDHLTSSMIYHSSTVTCVPSCMIVGGAATINVPTDNTTVGVFHAGGGTANRGLKISTFACINDNAGVRLDAQITVGGATLALATAGNDRLTISSCGNIGIGISAPQSIFHIGAPAPANSGVKAYTGLANSYEGFLFDYYYNTAASNLRLFDIVALGASTTGIGGSDIRFLTVPQTTTGTPIERMRITNGGNMGIGTCNPSSLLHLQSSASGGQNLRLQTSIAAGRNYMQFANGSGDMGYFGYGGANSKFFIVNQLNDDMLFYTNDQPRLTIESSGISTFSCRVSAPLMVPTVLGITTSALHGIKTFEAGPTSAYTINLPAEFPNALLSGGNVWGVVGKATFFGAGGTAEVRDFNIARNSGGSWASANYGPSSATSGGILQSVVGSGTCITINMNSNSYVTVELTAMVR